MRFFDTHAHIGLIFDDPIEQHVVCQRAAQADVKHIVSISNSILDFTPIYENLKIESNISFAAGISPSEVNNLPKDWTIKVQDSLKLPGIVALGEIGLDYFHKFGDKNRQVELFISQLDMAIHFDLPVIIHNRDAGNDVLEVLRDRLPAKGGVLHCYSENADYAKRALDLNLYFSFAGNLTYRNARNLHETVRVLPLDRILVESEAPFMVPAEYRNRRNKPEYIHSTVEALAELIETPYEEVAEAVYANACRFFGLSE